MRFSFWPAPSQPYREVEYLARHVESKGWDGIWFADHFMPNAEDTSGPWYEAWTTLAALAADIPRLRIGPLVTGNTYRHPAVLAKMAATLDHISGGRCVLGLGAGWQENEHRAYGLEFYDVPGRLARLEEACHVIKLLYTEEKANFDGEYYQLKDAPLVPKPVQSPLPLMIGGGGEKVTLRITAAHADEWNVWGTPDILEHKMNVLDRHCEDLGRDPKSIERSAVALLFLVDDEAQAEKIKASPPPMPSLIGTTDQLRDTVARFIELGVDELIVPDFNLGPREKKVATIDRFMEDVASVAR